MADITLEELARQIAELKAENEKLRGKQGGKRPSAPRSVEVGCNLVEGVQLTSPNGDVDLYIKRGEIIVLPDEDVRQILKKSANRKLFINGLLYFTDADVYEELNVKRKFNINEDIIQSLVESNDTEAISNFFNNVTNNRLDLDMTHTVFYTIVILNLGHRIDRMRYETRQFIEKYFSMELEMAGRLYLDLKKVEF